MNRPPRKIARWETVRPIRDRDWILRIVWCQLDPAPDTGEDLQSTRPGRGRAWFSCGPVGEPPRTFDRDVPQITPELCNHFIRLVTRMANML